MRHLLDRLRASKAADRLPDGTYVELVQSLFLIVVPAVIMTVCFAGTGAYILHRSDDTLLALLYSIGLVASAARLGALFGYRDRARAPGLAVGDALRIERRFGAGYLAFAAAFGLFAGRAYWVVDADLHIVLVALVFGYAAGVAATVSLRLWISISAILMAVVPMVVASLFMSGAAYWGTGLLTLLFLLGGIGSMLQRYSDTSSQISMRRLMETLARQDPLTDLPNRLVLRERFEEFVTRGTPDATIAVHCVDINQLEPVNEMYGHMAGDQLLKAVAQRLRRVVRGENLVIHLNGDDFVIIQPNMASTAEADALAHQVVAKLDKNYAVGGEDIIITANIGYAFDLQHGAKLEHLIGRAERALADSKRQASGVAAYGNWGGAQRSASAASAS